MRLITRMLYLMTPLNILWLAAAFRLVAVLFSGGFAFSDDHLEVVEIAWMLSEGIPVWQPGEVYVHNMIYPGLHYAVIVFFKYINITNPEFLMFIFRLLHAAVSLIAVWYGYKLARSLTRSELLARGFMFAMGLFWLMPFMSVRNLREFVCLAALMPAFYFISKKQFTATDLLKAGALFAAAFMLRYQTAFFPLGAGVWLLMSGRWKDAAVLTAGFVLLFVPIFCVTDYMLWGNPVASLLYYFDYNAQNSHLYPNGPWHQYLGTVAGLCLPPACLLLIVGYISRGYNVSPVIFISSMLFFVFHSYFPNKQERFILPFIPFFILLGILGLYELCRNHPVSYRKYKKLIFGLTVFGFWLNLAALLVLTPAYSKRSRVEAMNMLRERGDVTALLMEGEGGVPFPPMFYLGKKVPYYAVTNGVTADEALGKAKAENVVPNYLIMCSDKDFAGREKIFQEYFPGMQQVGVARAGLVDNIAHYLNPSHNKNEDWYIYKIY